MKKISVLTPTYNDEKSLVETLNSLINQTYQNWELVIIDDGSTDDTKNIIDNFKKKYDNENKIMYKYQENADQLNAILNGINEITGDYVFVLHSDDLLPNENFFKSIVEYIEKEDCDALIGDLEIINDSSRVVDYWKVLKYNNSKYTPTLLQLYGGANIYSDVALWKKDIYLDYVKENYLIWNVPFWIDIRNNPKILNVKNANFPILKYRIHENNYINNNIGKFNVLNGELRALTTLLNYYSIPAYNLQQFIWKVFVKFKLKIKFRPFYFNKSTRNKYKILKQKIKKTYGDEYNNNLFLHSLVEFYKNGNEREIKLDNLNEEDIYLGKDIKKFTKKLFSNELPKLYYDLFDEMKKGFKKINVKNSDQKEKAIKVAKFLCIYPYVEVVINKENYGGK